MTEFALAMIDRLQNALWISSSDWICLWFLWHTSAASRQIHIKYIFYFIFYFYLIMFIYHLLKTINRIKGLLEKVCNMLYKYSLSDTFRKFVLLKCWVFTLLYPTEIPNACLILEKHVRVLFEGNILLTAWLQDLHNFTELTLFSSAEFFPRQCDSCSGFGFLLWGTQKLSLASFLSLLSLSAVFCEQTITCWRNNKSLLGNGTTSWEFCFQLINLMYLKFRSF